MSAHRVCTVNGVILPHDSLYFVNGERPWEVLNPGLGDRLACCSSDADAAEVSIRLNNLIAEREAARTQAASAEAEVARLRNVIEKAKGALHSISNEFGRGKAAHVAREAEHSLSDSIRCDSNRAPSAVDCELAKLRGIIARNAQQRLAGEDAKEMFVTAADMQAGIDILHEEIAAGRIVGGASK